MSYTKDQVDVLIRSLDRRVEKVVACQGSAVKLRAAERDLLGDAESSRDLLNHAVKGDKVHLADVFGGTCERIGRLRQHLDTVTLSAMHESDKRWGDLRKAVETIEAILKDMGSFRPWKPSGVQGVETINYKKARRRLSPGRRVAFFPEIEGGDVSMFSVEPALPAGLLLNPENGAITGTVAGEVPTTTYTVTASNDSGEATVELTFSVAGQPPTGLAYPTMVPEVTAGDKCGPFEPAVEGGFPSHFVVSPELPAGIWIDEDTGVISGEAEGPAPLGEYVVTASNGGGEVTCTVSLAVVVGPPKNLRYPGCSDAYTTGKPFEVRPYVDGMVEAYSVEPALPAGVVLNNVTGEITGIPTTVADAASYTVTSTNSAGSTSTTVNFAIQRAPPSELSYPEAAGEYPHGRPMPELCPTFVGEVFDFTVSPPLPEGLSLDPKTGVISGTPMAATDPVTYEVTGSNDQGTVTTPLSFAVKVMPPKSVAYPSMDDSYQVGEEVGSQPQVDGGATHFSVSPALPAGLEIDPNTGLISGAGTVITEKATYTVTASNDGGSATTEVTFGVIEAAPPPLSYGTASGTYTVGNEMLIEPDGSADYKSSRTTFTVSPALPDGMSLDANTGVISGTPAAEAPEATYKITARNRGGESSANVTFTVEKVEELPAEINIEFAKLIEECMDIAELPDEPSKSRHFGDWMVWMVHRAFLNDPSLVDFNFSNMSMPPPFLVWQIAPKLMKALETNTFIENLSLSNSSLQKPQGHEMADALKQNRTLKYLNIESNNIDSACLTDIALGIKANASTQLETVRLSHQQGLQYYGRPVEEAMGGMMEANKSICKLGFTCQDAHWRNTIDRYLLRNNDMARRRRKRKSSQLEEMLPQEEKTLSKVIFEAPPCVSLADAFGEQTPAVLSFIGFLAANSKLPTPPQLQSFAKTIGLSVSFKDAKPGLESCRAKMLAAAVGSGVTVADGFNVSTGGSLYKWDVRGENWMLDVLVDGGSKRFIYKSAKSPSLEVSPAWGEWLNST